MNASQSAQVGDVLDGRYRLEQVIGQGGMGTVYRAADEALGRVVAVKVFRPELSDAADQVRRESEKKLLASLSHPSLVTLFDAHLGGTDTSYLIMEYIDGGTLASRFTEGPVSPADASSLAADLGEALHVVHEAGIIHRDVKPANILLRPPLSPDHTFRATLADFGIAYLIDTTRVTVPGTTIGTAAYISPEQVRGESPTPASDIYSLGLVLVEALTGSRAFAQQTPIEAVAARLNSDPEIPGGFGYEWRSLLTAMTSRDPLQRPTALEVARLGRELDSGGGAEATELLADPGQGSGSDQPTRVLDATTDLPPTAVLPTEAAAPSSAATTVLLHPRDETGTAAVPPSDGTPETPTTPSKRRRRAIIGAIVAGAALLILVIVVWIATMSAPSTPPTLAEVEEPLASHLQLLLEQVTP